MNREPIIIDSITIKPSMQKLKIQTAIGTIESDSGSHLIDVLTIVGVVLVVYVGKKLVDKFFRGI
tara:strand:- start:274 stop:468 length:195 start_codon:yes stop_codon:yes gene_type:complete